MSEMRRVGIMGGTFDPIHIGHLILGECAFEQFSLDSVLFMPSGNPPHKRDKGDRASNEHRIRMTELAIASNPHFELSLEEMGREGYIYTNETLRRLRQAHPDTEYYFIMGADSLIQFDDWRNPQIIADLAVLTVAVRNDMTMEELEKQADRVRERYHARVLLMNVPNMEISSTELRRRFAGGLSCRYYLPDSVISYIETNRIYRNEKDD